MAVFVPDKPWILAFDTGAVEKLGAFQVGSAQDLQYVLLTLLKRGAGAGSERLRLRLYPTAGYETPTYVSDWRALADVTADTYWIGIVRFDFSAPAPLNPHLTYHVAVETENYMHTATFELAARLDWPDALYSSPSATRRGAQLRLCGLRQPYRTTEQGSQVPMGQLRRVQIAEGVTLTAPTDLETGPRVDFTWPPATAELDVDVSAYVGDAQKVGWILSRPSGSNFEQILAVITKPDAATVHISVDGALATGTYRLTGT